jgi:hypothetical protein
MGRNGAGVALLAVMAGLPAAAQETCAEAPVIRQLAGAILEGRAELTGLHPRRHGAEAVYLALHYGGMEEGAARAVLEALDAEGVPEAHEILASLVIAREGVAAGLAVIDPDPVRAFVEAGRSVRSAVIAADGGVTYFRLRREAEARPDLAGDVVNALAAGWELPVLTANLPDEVVAAIAATAEAEGDILSALKLLAGLPDMTAYAALLERRPEAADLAEEARNEVMIATLRHGTGPVPRSDPAAQAERGATDARLYAVMEASYQSGPASYLSTVMNQTGLEVEVAAVAVAYLAEVEAGRVDASVDTEAAWLMQYRGLEVVLGTEGAQRVMRGYDFPPPRVRHYAASAIETLDWMLAVEVLGPVVRGEVAAMPDRPKLMSDTLDWPLWTRVAEAAAAGTWNGEAPEVAAELLVAAGQWDAMMAATERLAMAERLGVWRDVMQRLDRGCDGWMASRGQGLILGGDTLWRF